MAECPAHCATWARQLMGYCLCSTKDGVSLALGLASVISWGVAEIPQIMTNFKAKSTHGLSFAFLLTWIIGDFFNVFGCWLEPATLPTQFYMALLYTVTTLTLTLQSVYYTHIYPQLKCNRQHQKIGKPDPAEATGQHSLDGNYSGENGSYGNIPTSTMLNSDTSMSSPIPFQACPRTHSAEQDSYYTSARSLSTSHTPTRSSFIAPRRAPTLEEVEDSVEAPLLGRSLPTRPVPASKTKNLLCVVSAVTFILGTLNIASTKDTRLGLVFETANNVVAGYETRKLLQVNGQKNISAVASGNGGIGTFLGWAMAVIYMGGRLPQIWLNIRRGNVEGLNPFMFIFALLGNTTYVASILVNSLDWSKIMPNMPWLVDAGGCALLDTFFIYFQWHSKHLVS